MSCDIHTHIEYNQNLCVGTTYGERIYKKKWVCGDYYKLNPYFEFDTTETEYELVGFHDDRDYTLFSILANVRNYGDTKYIDEPRGIPNDCSKQVRNDCEEWDCDGHSHSYFTLYELITWLDENSYDEDNTLISLIDDMKKRADEDYFIRSYLWEIKPQEALEKAKDMRIVFWFDN